MFLPGWYFSEVAGVDEDIGFWKGLYFYFVMHVVGVWHCQDSYFSCLNLHILLYPQISIFVVKLSMQ